MTLEGVGMGDSFQFDDEEEGTSSVVHIRRVPASSSSSHGRHRLLWSKSHVYVHPSPRKRDNLCGFLSLVRTAADDVSPAAEARGANVLLAWIPNAVLMTKPTDLHAYTASSECGYAASSSDGDRVVDDGAETGPYFYVDTPPVDASYAFSVPLSDVSSLIVRPPRTGWGYGSIVVNVRGEQTTSHPALYFHDNECPSTIAMGKQLAKSFDPFSESGEMFWGGEHFMSYLRSLVKVTRSTHEPNVFLVNPGVEKEERVGIKPPTKSSTSSTKFWEDAKWTVLERLSRITRFGRDAASRVAEHPITTREILPRLPPRVRAIVVNENMQQLTEEYDAARMYLAKWAAGIADQADKDRRRDFPELGVMGGLGEWEENSDLGTFEVLSTSERAGKRAPLGQAQWNSFFDEEGYLSVTVKEVKDIVFHGGMEPALRKEVWKFFLGIYDWHSSRAERKAVLASKRDEYYRLKRIWYDDFDRRHSDSHFLDQKSRIEKDVHRTDRSHPFFAEEDLPHPDGADSLFTGTNIHMEMCKDILLTYNEYNRDLGYVQGMSDLLAPLYVVMEDDAAAFWALCGLMERMQVNFYRDQSGMRRQLLTLAQLVQLLDPKLYRHLEAADSLNFFCFFRMLLVWFKREFAWDDVLRLWEVLFTDYLTHDYQLFVALSILEQNKVAIMDHLRQFDEILKYFNDLSMHIDLDATLERAELLYGRFQQIVQTIDRRNEELRARAASGPSGPAGGAEAVLISENLRALMHH